MNHFLTRSLYHRTLVTLGAILAFVIAIALISSSRLDATPSTTAPDMTPASSRQQTSLAQAASTPHAAMPDGSHPASAVVSTPHRVDPKSVLGADPHFSLGGCALGYGIPGEQCVTRHNKTTACLAAQQQSKPIVTPPNDWLHLYLNDHTSCSK